jgi:RHS repeat-associated protein
LTNRSLCHERRWNSTTQINQRQSLIVFLGSHKQNGTTTIGDLTYEYDKAGNRTKTGGSWARTGIPEPLTSTSYDANNRQLTFGDKTLAYDDNGNLQSITDSNGTTLYQWNARNQLAAISGPNANASFVYDGAGRRQKKTVNGNLTEFLYDGLNPVQEASGANILANILPGLGIDEFFTRTDIGAGVTSSFLADALGSAIAVADSAGVAQTSYTYDAFGQTTVTGASNASSYQYTGRENDGTGLYYYRARYYAPLIQRFISQDPIGFTGGDLNLYAYVGNQPTNRDDPLGLQWRPGPLIEPNPVGEGMRHGGDALDWAKDRREANSEYDDKREVEDEKIRKLREAGKQFECDTQVLVCWRIHTRGKSTPIPGTVAVYTAGWVTYTVGVGVRCEWRLAPGRSNNCCKQPS